MPNDPLPAPDRLVAFFDLLRDQLGTKELQRLVDQAVEVNLNDHAEVDTLPHRHAYALTGVTARARGALASLWDGTIPVMGDPVIRKPHSESDFDAFVARVAESWVRCVEAREAGILFEARVTNEGGVSDHTEAAPADSVLEVVRNHLESVHRGGGKVTVEIERA